MISKPMRPLFLIFVLAFAGCGAPGAAQDAGSGPGTCIGVCAPHAPSGWYATSLLWIGPSGATAPSCPPFMPAPFAGFVDTAPTVECPTCLCTPSSASCLLPYQMSANADACPGDGSGAEQFNASETWDGTCDAMSPVSAAASLTVQPPPGPAAGNCTPVAGGPISIQGPTAAEVCESATASVAPGSCGDQSMICAYPKAQGFLTCIVKFGDVECAAGWTEKHLVFENADACGCTCGAPSGDSCSATVTVYKDGACLQPLGSVMVSSNLPKACVDVTAGSAFGSKSSTPPIYQAGTCAPSPTPTHPSTFCCLP
jgi:hypothetical protein